MALVQLRKYCKRLTDLCSWLLDDDLFGVTPDGGNYSTAPGELTLDTMFFGVTPNGGNYSTATLVKVLLSSGSG